MVAADLRGQVNFRVSDPDGDTVQCVLSVEGIGKFTYPNCKTLSRTYLFPATGTYRVSLEASDRLASTRKSINLLFEDTGPKFLPFSYLPPQFNQAEFGCSLTAAGLAYCWGGADQMGNEFVENQVPGLVTMPTGVTFAALATGASHACALTAEGSAGGAGLAYCWGQANDGRLGLGSAVTTTQGIPMPVVMPAGVTFKQITAGNGHTCALSAAGSTGGAGKAYCWGDGAYGATGQGYCPPPVSGVKVKNGCSVGSVESHGGSTLLGTPAGPPKSDPLWEPALVVGGHTYIDISAGNTHTCAIKDSGSAYCWGRDDWGNLGDGVDRSGLSSPQDRVFEPTATQMPGGVTFSSISSGGVHTCALTALGSTGGAGQVYCWGSGGDGELGNGGTTNQDTPVQVTMPGGVSQVAQISAADDHVCALIPQGLAYCWGSGDEGRLGNMDTNEDPQSTPVAVAMPAGVVFSSVAAGDNFACALEAVRGQMYCWGAAGSFQLGNGDDEDDQYGPVPAVMPPL